MATKRKTYEKTVLTSIVFQAKKNRERFLFHCEMLSSLIRQYRDALLLANIRSQFSFSSTANDTHRHTHNTQSAQHSNTCNKRESPKGKDEERAEQKCIHQSLSIVSLSLFVFPADVLLYNSTWPY
jgi:hypothetical protein